MDRLTIYLFPGQGADHRLFSKFEFGDDYKVVHITYPEPRAGETIKSFAWEIAPQIDQSEPYVLIGTSLGGMICCELAAFMKPEKVIIISSARCRHELRPFYKIQSWLRINKLLPGRLLKWGALFFRPFVEPDVLKNRDVFEDMMRSKTAQYFTHTVNMIVNWDREESDPSIVHIHGTGDRTLPFKRIKRADYVVPGGSHMMTLTRGEEVFRVICGILQNLGKTENSLAATG